MNETPLLPDKTAPRWPPLLSLLRLAAALGLTFAFLPYAWGRTAVVWMLIGHPEPEFALQLVLCVVTVMVVTRNLSDALGRPAWDRWVLGSVALVWIAWNVALLALRAGPLLPWWYVALPFVPATLWVVWLAWMLYRPLAWNTHVAVLTVLLLLGAGGLSLVKAEGLTGGSNVNFTWRWGKKREQPIETAAGIADLTKTSDRDYAQYLGPLRLAVLPNARLARDWQQHPPRLLWRRGVGEGWGSFSVAGDFAITQEQRGKDECVVCYRVDDGSVVWTHSDPVRFDNSLGGPGPRATPTIANGRVFTVGATGLLNCLDGATGKALWTVDILADNGGKNIEHGVCGSPLVLGDLVIVCPTGTADASLVAYEAATGQRRWQAGGQKASYGSPLLAELAGMPQILIHAAEGVAGHDPQTGQPLWSFPWTNRDRINCAQPLPNAGAPGQVFAGTGYGEGSTLVRIERDTEGNWTCQPLWKNRWMKLKYTTAVLHDGHIYGLDDGILECLDVTNGKKLWKDGRYEHGQLLLAGGLLVIQAENGDVALVEPSPEGLRELGRFTALEGKTWNHPALAGKYLLVHNDHEAACYEVAAEK